MTAPPSTISVVIPSYDGAAYIRDTIGSVLRQTVLPAEIVVVDDCSEDRTVAAVSEVAEGAAIPVRLVRLGRNSGGPAHPINVGVEAASSPLVAVLEQDDLMTPTRIARSLAAFAAFPAAGLVCGRVRLRSSSGTIREDLWWDGHRQFDELSLAPIAAGVYRADSPDVISALLRRNIVFTNSNAVFSRETWQHVGGFDRAFRICSDLDFNLKVARVAPFALIDEVVCDYYQRDDSLYNSNRGPERGYSPAQSEAALIRLQHATRLYGPRSQLGREWYRRGWRMLASDCKHLRWRQGARVLRVLYSTGGVSWHAATTLLRAFASWRRGSAETW